MTRPYSKDLRGRPLARAGFGEMIRMIAQALAISPSRVSKWRKLKRETGTLSPGQIGGHKKPALPCRTCPIVPPSMRHQSHHHKAGPNI